MAYANGFPATYQQPYAAYQQPYAPYQQQPQMMTPPTIRAEIVQVENEQAAINYPVGAGSSQMMIARDESAIFVKTAGANGQVSLDVFVKRPPEPPKPTIDVSAFVTRDEVTKLIDAALSSLQPHGDEVA